MARNWIILRCSNASTLDLARSLQAEGIDVWTPLEIIGATRRYGKTKPAREAPLMPSFVFADAAATARLLGMSRSPSLTWRQWDSAKRRMVTRGIPHFRLFQIGDSIPTVPNAQLSHLQTIDRKQRAMQQQVSPGDAFRFTSGGFEGLDGVVDAINGQNATVTIEGFPVALTMPLWMVAAALTDNSTKAA